MGGWHGMGWGGMVWGWLFLAVLVVGVALLVIALVHGWNSARKQPPAMGRSRAREILDERYAQGEIDTSEYQERLQQLGERT